MADPRQLFAPSRKKSFLNSLDPRLKIIFVILSAITAVSAQNWQPLAVMVILGIAGLFLTRDRFIQSIKAVIMVDSFIFIMLLTLPFTVPGTPAFSILGVPASVAGIDQAVLIALKTNAVMTCSLTLFAGMDANDLGQGLRGIGVPIKLVSIFLMTARYIDVLHREYLRLRTAMRLRGFTPKTNIHTLRSFGYLLGMLLVRSHDRSERILWAMKCRGFNGTPYFTQLQPPKKCDVICFTIGLIVLALMIVMEILCPRLI